ncbi:MAG: hypothetical protein Q7R43_02435 [Candidatus Daviesbacteria bacterium]|nr:hypothetical protein [Candidatus Daviesbacteria bacterium]
MIPKNSYHFSIDDVFDSLIEVSDKKIPLFDQLFFKFLKKIHEEFYVNIGLYLFYQKKIKGRLRTLKEVSNLKTQLEKIDWLFFAPHALEYEIPPYAQSIDEQINTFEKIYTEIDRFAGKSFHTKYIRLQYYSESFELVEYFKTKEVEALFTTDREIGSHRMPTEIGFKLIEKGYIKYKGMDFIRTQFRVEFFAKEEISEEEVLIRMKNAFNKYGFIVFYTHEVDIMNEKGRKMSKLMFKATKKLNLVSIKKP